MSNAQIMLGKRVMRTADIYLDVHRDRGVRGLPLERVYKHLFDPELYFRAYGKIYRNAGATTKGITVETVDSMNLKKIHKIIEWLRLGVYQWTPVRRTEIPKANGMMRPLGLPCWSDKLVQEVLRQLLEPYYEQRFSIHSHGFRPNRGCHSALRDIRDHWIGTVWFIEGDIKGCYDNIDHEIMLGILRRDIHDDRLVKLIGDLLKAGYMQDGVRQVPTCGTPQGGILSPLLANVYLTEMDRFIEDTLDPLYIRGEHRKKNPSYARVCRLLTLAKEEGDLLEVKRLKAERRKYQCADSLDVDYRRLRYVRYADDFLLGFVGPGSEACALRDRLGEFLGQQLKLTLSAEKTLITHAGDDNAKFLGYEIKVIRAGNLISKNGHRTSNGHICFRMPREVVQKYFQLYSRGGKVIHRADLLDDSEYTIVQRYQGVLVGLYNYYCMASNVSKRMSHIKWILQKSLLKTLASKLRTRVSEINKMYRVPDQEFMTYRVTMARPEKEPLTATFGGISLGRIPDGKGKDEFDSQAAWHRPAGCRSEVVMHLIHGKCSICGIKGVEMHHIRKLADIDRPGRRPKALWERIMAARKRKAIPVCSGCHDSIHAGRYDGSRLGHD